MKKQLKLLTDKEKYAICNKYMKDKNGEYSGLTYTCRGLECPLSLQIGKELFCFKDIDYLEEKIKEYWNNEVDVDG